MTSTFDIPSTTGTLDDDVDTDVVVIGAGPLGLTLANALAHHGLRFRVLEQRTRPSAYSKANNVWSRPQELPASTGVRDAVAESSYAVAGERAPDARVTPPDGRTTSLFEHLYDPDGHSWGWCVLAFDGRDRSTRPALTDAISAAAGHAWVHPRLVLSDPLPDEDAAAAACLQTCCQTLTAHPAASAGASDQLALSAYAGRPVPDEEP